MQEDNSAREGCDSLVGYPLKVGYPIEIPPTPYEDRPACPSAEMPSGPCPRPPLPAPRDLPALVSGITRPQQI